ncbi:SAM hydrolase/SAM-dependent halogenase family protein [Flavihumibacter fluvii]|uniref:SAM hydrolase/SAM-dependent halogenase family protein n=1 Tax=Flavihumibacter fluvii TaxID=2838157 RepID=UPI001BDF2116|nr:SAM-dependent chlorinase/fluorinase [Flavihumibacter fluvii]ULQ53814.1 SAM-dependent chlorinase/fluorinase [Flavihumibacter fluvii]
MSLLTLTSDIGNQDYLAAAIKGQLLQIDPGFTIIDITHQISPFNYPQAAYICRNAIRHFPEFTFHLVMVNLFEQKPDQLILAFHQNQYILCADNGLLGMILEERPEMVIGLPCDKMAIRSTLYCAGVFGNAIAAISRGERLTSIGEPDVVYLEKNPLKPLLSDTWIEGQIIYIDNFENVIVNITREQFEAQRKGRRFSIVFKRDEVIEKISETYADVPEGEKLALFNSAGYLEIAINKGNAAGLFGLQGYLEQAQNAYLQNRLFYQTVKILFA